METPESVARFLQGKRIAVVGVSRKGDTAANAIFKKLQKSGYEAIPVNPNAEAVEETRCYPDVTAIPGELDGVVIATHPDVSAEVVRQCRERGVARVWFHRSFGSGSVSEEAVREREVACRDRGDWSTNASVASDCMYGGNASVAGVR